MEFIVDGAFEAAIKAHQTWQVFSALFTVLFLIGGFFRFLGKSLSLELYLTETNPYSHRMSCIERMCKIIVEGKNAQFYSGSSI